MNWQGACGVTYAVNALGTRVRTWIAISGEPWLPLSGLIKEDDGLRKSPGFRACEVGFWP